MSFKKLLDAFTLLSVIAALVAVPAFAQTARTERQVLYTGCSADEKPLRLHILAASDEPFDQGVKLAVRDQVVNYLESEISECCSKEEAMYIIESRMPLIERLCNTCLARCGVPYSAQVRLETADFPAISYNETVFAAGDYDALRIVLGPGEGHNWWCVLFPPLCFVDLAVAVDEDAVIAAWSESYEEDRDDESGYRISWKLPELMHKQ